MKFLVVGAGALGGYFGGRLLEAGQDVTFLLRPARAAALARGGLVVRSRFGDATLAAPPVVLAGAIGSTFDVVLVACKSFDLAATLDAVAPAVGAGTTILPLLNGMRHLDAIGDRFGATRVLGGLCMISATLGADGAVEHLNDTHTLAFGELDGGASPRTRALLAAMSAARFDARASDDIAQDLWEKWIFIASLAGLTCLMRAPVGDIVEAGGAGLGARLYAECSAIAAANGYAPRAPAAERALAMLGQAGSPFSASMAKDIERGAPIEADHIVGDLLRRAQPDAAADAGLLRLAHVHLRAYEARRAREAAHPGTPTREGGAPAAAPA